MNRKPLHYSRDDLQRVYFYDCTEPLAIRWKINPGHGGSFGDIAGYWQKGYRRIYIGNNNRTTPLEWAVWVYHHDTEPPKDLRKNPTNPNDYRIENLIVLPRPKEASEVRKAKNLAHLRRYIESFTPEQWKVEQLKMRLRRYGITPSYYELLYDMQNGVCAICSKPETQVRKQQTGTVDRLAVDHCHTANRVRGLLCNLCNRGIGFFADDPALLRAAADYLDRFSS